MYAALDIFTILTLNNFPDEFTEKIIFFALEVKLVTCPTFCRKKLKFEDTSARSKQKLCSKKTEKRSGFYWNICI